MHGLLVINKPAGMTSHDVVNAVRHIAQTRRVGHTGTLDPMATGVLLLLVGSATRLAQFMADHTKVYRAVVRLGAVTTTYDREGDVLEQHPVQVTRAACEETLAHFRGTIQQIPPMYSAIKVAGKKLYELARQGKMLDRAPRTVTLYRLDLVDWNPPDLILEVVCSAGTYVRSLAHDLGQVLGCGAYLHALTRVAVGDFNLEMSRTLEALRDLASKNALSAALLPPAAALVAMPEVRLTAHQVQAVRYGQSIGDLSTPPECIILKALDQDGHLVAVLIPADSERWRPKVVI
ncbi:MAG: tRNA pseudouridine(55) synthase TruB [Anaerolineae bacterium]|nr:tRNA pseudouridine(55) synthase TruB [Anaerolineae bacterium]